MGYLHINNLYKDQTILMFRECYALEKIHGTSAHIYWKNKSVGFFSGGEKYDNFIKLFDVEKIAQLFVQEVGDCDCVVYGEAYGGKCQGMSATYGKELKFVVFDVKIGDCWLDVSKAENVAQKLELEFVHYKKISTDLSEIDGERDFESVQAIRNGVGSGKLREGVVLRPLIELTKNNGERVISKHKREEFAERRNTPKIVDVDKQKVLEKAQDIAEEWVTPMRLEHVLQSHLDVSGIEDVGKLIKYMVEDVYREAKGEIAEGREVSAAIGKRTVLLWKQKLKNVLA